VIGFVHRQTICNYKIHIGGGGEGGEGEAGEGFAIPGSASGRDI